MESLPALQDNQVDLLISQAIDKNVSVETLEKLLVMRKELKQEYAREEFNKALALFQEKCPIIKKTKKVYGKSGFIYAYAPIDSIVAQVKSLQKECGFSYIARTSTLVDRVDVTIIVRHIAGHEEWTTVGLPLVAKTAVMNDSQQVTATITLAKRYAFCNAFGILTGEGDTDGVMTQDKISEEQIDRIRDLLLRTGYKEESIYRRFRVLGLDMLTYEQAQQTIYALQKAISDVKD